MRTLLAITTLLCLTSASFAAPPATITIKASGLAGGEIARHNGTFTLKPTPGSPGSYFYYDRPVNPTTGWSVTLGPANRIDAIAGTGQFKAGWVGTGDPASIGTLGPLFGGQPVNIQISVP